MQDPFGPQPTFEAEQGVLGALILGDANLRRQVLAIVSVADFSPQSHREIFSAIQAVEAGGGPVDIVTVHAELRRRGTLDECGGTDYLVAIVNETPAAEHVLQYARFVHEAARERSRKSATDER